MRIERLLWIVLLAAPLSAQTAPTANLTPRQSLQKFETQWAQGHRFTTEDLRSLDKLHDDLVAANDPNRAAELDLLKLAASASVKAQDDKVKAKASLADDTDRWDLRERRLREQGFWRHVRDIGLLGFTASTTLTLMLAAVNDRNLALLSNSSFSADNFKNDFNNGMQWAMVGSVTTMFVSLFPLLWGEARQ